METHKPYIVCLAQCQYYYCIHKQEKQDSPKMPNGQSSDSPIMLIRNILKLRMLGPETYCLYKQK